MAEAFRLNGAKCSFVCRELDGDLIQEISRRGFPLYTLFSKPKIFFSESDEYSNQVNSHNSISIDWAEDAQQTIACLASYHVDLLIVDHYDLDIKWESLIRPVCKYLMVIDDLANRPHDCDILLDQNNSEEIRYKKLVSNQCHMLLGPLYALLRPEYLEFRKKISERSNEINKVFIYFGGSDLHDITSMALRALMIPELDQLEVDIVIGQNYLPISKLQRLAFVRGKTEIHYPRAHLAELMSNADVAIGAGGATSWERICLGLPSIVISMAENQIDISRRLHDSGLIQYLGGVEEVTESQISNAMLQEMDFLIQRKRNFRMESLCDGLGLSRVFGVIKSILNHT